MTKIKQKFFNWFGKSLEQIDVTDWDEKVITDPEFQKEIRKSSKVQLCYSYIESKMAHQYAKIIIIQLNNAFADLAEDDFRVPKGFSNREKASPGLNAYFDLRGCVATIIFAFRGQQ